MCGSARRPGISELLTFVVWVVTLQSEVRIMFLCDKSLREYVFGECEQLDNIQTDSHSWQVSRPSPTPTVCFSLDPLG